MAINLNHSEVPTRENRLGSITGYQGTIRDLVEQAACGSLRNKERCFSQASACSSGCAQGQLSRIVDAAVVNHGPVGCAADTVAGNTVNKWGQHIRGWEHKNIQLINTNMVEEDTVFGAVNKLREAVQEAYKRFNPKAIFITTSCVSGIIGEDIQSVIEELQDEIPVPIGSVHCEGFRSKIWATGFDAAFHAVLTTLVKPPEKKSNTVNVINFNGSARKQIAEMLAPFGLEPVFLLPYSSVEQLTHLSEAVATISICGTLGSYIGNALEQQYGVPYVKTLQPHGLAGMNSWLRGLGAVIGKEAEVEEYIRLQEERIAPELAEIRSRLKGCKAVVGMGPSFGQNYIRTLRELGIEVIWGSTWHFDPQHDNGSCPASAQYLAAGEDNIPVSVADQQNFEIINLLNRLKPDLYVARHGGTTVWATKLGIPSIMINDEYTAYGYQGLIDFGYRIVDALTNRSLAKNLAARVKLPYTDWWLQQDSFSLLQEAAR
ncbi:nitrogenase component 1 [Sporomusa sp. KB1]|uniref:nitrogenase component 1 n=1 Tax=Sporomusa sp. KB1 TaxID=943346 RepID=UPI0011A62C96|nr:nitrogenase component 1 [Sporomusa sp. KB1]TWH47540.1 nitrogenase molybdenum-iron protein alpha chain [Sporomusa sp. KB1]